MEILYDCDMRARLLSSQISECCLAILPHSKDPRSSEKQIRFAKEIIEVCKFVETQKTDLRRILLASGYHGVTSEWVEHALECVQLIELRVPVAMEISKASLLLPRVNKHMWERGRTVDRLPFIKDVGLEILDFLYGSKCLVGCCVTCGFVLAFSDARVKDFCSIQCKRFWTFAGVIEEYQDDILKQRAFADDVLGSVQCLFIEGVVSKREVSEMDDETLMSVRCLFVE